MKKVASIATGRIYRLVNPTPEGWGAAPLLMTCDGVLPIEYIEADYSLSERLGLICEECREKVFFTQPKKVDTDKRKYVTGAFYAHYSTKQKEFCSHRHQTPEGKAAYRQVLAPVARGQWLNRFQRCFIWAILADPVEPIILEAQKHKARVQREKRKDGTVDLTFNFQFIQPIFYGPRLSARVKEYDLNHDNFTGPITETILDPETRRIFHRAMDITLDRMIAEKNHDVHEADLKHLEQQRDLLGEALEQAEQEGAEEIELPENIISMNADAAKVFKTHSIVRVALIQQAEGGELAQRHCMHMALDFLLAAPQRSVLKKLIVDSLSVLDAARDPAFERFEVGRRRFGLASLKADTAIEQKKLEDAREEITAAINNLRVGALEYIVQRIATCPWIYIWQSACEYGDIQREKTRRANKRKASPTRGKGFG